MAELDALMSLAYAAQFGGDGAPMCRPTFVEPQSSGLEGSSGHVSSSAVYTPSLHLIPTSRHISVKASLLLSIHHICHALH